MDRCVGCAAMCSVAASGKSLHAEDDTDSEDEVRSWRLRLPPDTLLSFRGRLRVNYLGFTVSSIKTLTGNYDFTYAGIQCYSPVN